jgi:hypothetical protein
MSDFQVNVLTGLAVLLDAEDLGTWRPDETTYEDDETAIVFGKLPQTPDRVIALTAYPVSDHGTLSDSILAVQILTRWEGEDPRPVSDLSDKIFDFLHGKEEFTLSTGVHVVRSDRNSGVSLGQDTNNRWEWSDNYYLKLHRPSANRT